MRLISARVRSFKSIDDSRQVTIDPEVTVLVGQNEAGKTAFLQALEKARPIRKGIKFDVTEDYPRKSLNEYRRQHEKTPAAVVDFTFELSDQEVTKVNTKIGVNVLQSNQFTLTHKYNNSSNIGITADEPAFIKFVVKKAKLAAEVSKRAMAAPTVRELLQLLEESDLNAEGQEFLAQLKERFSAALKHGGWSNLLAYEVWHTHIGEPGKFLYFGDYQLLPGKVNLPGLASRVADPDELTDEDHTVLRLLHMAEVDLKDVMAKTGYEEAKARLEGLSNRITDQVFEYWTQNRELDVEFDIRADPADSDARFQSGPNLYIRIRNRRHRVTVPFSQRSKGFIWFFSFLVWFDSVRAEGIASPVILLLDEPGLSLHALAQADLLRYIDKLSQRHQVLYSTHSPFMVHSDRLHQVRLVEDRLKDGTVVTDNVTGSDPKTVFPLQAALGYTIAQNLFISKRNVLVEGPADLVYLRYFSAQLEEANRTALRDDATVVPCGGLDKVATFIALLGGNELKTVVVHDFGARPDARLESLVREKIIREKEVLNYAMFRVPGQTTGSTSTDVEDLLSEDLYLNLFNQTFAKELKGRNITMSDLPAGDRIVERLERFLEAEKIQLRPSGGFNHYRVASHLAANPRSADADTLARFESLFRAVNDALK